MTGLRETPPPRDGSRGDTSATEWGSSTARSPRKKTFVALTSLGIVLVLAALALLYRAFTPSETPTPAHAPAQEAMDLDLLEDAFVWESKPDRTFGGWETFFIWEGSHALLSFSAADIPRGAEVVSATLTLSIHGHSTAAGALAVVEVLEGASTWDETSVTWNNQPSVDPHVPSSESILAAAQPGAADVWDVTALLQEALDRLPTPTEDLGSPKIPTIGFRLRFMEPVALRQEWWSKESNEPSARLRVALRGLERCCVDVHVEPPEARDVGCRAEIDPTARWCGTPVNVTTAAAPGWVVERVDGPSFLQGRAPNCAQVVVTFQRTLDVDCGVDTVVRPDGSAGSASASPTSCRCGTGQTELTAVPQEGWVFHHWEEYAEQCSNSRSCTVACPARSRQRAVAVFAPVLTVTGHYEDVMCPPEGVTDRPILTVTLCASQANSWTVESIGVRAGDSGRGTDNVDRVILSRNGTQMGVAELDAKADGEIEFDAGNLFVPAGECVNLSLRYHFASRAGYLCGDRTVECASAAVPASLIEARPTSSSYGSITGGAEGRIHIGCVINQHARKAFDGIQAAIDDPATEALHTLTVCPGRYSENVRVTESLSLVSEKGSKRTVIQAADAIKAAIETTREMTVVDGFTVSDAREDWGIAARRGVTLRDVRVTGNGGGVLNERGDFSADGLLVRANTGDGLVVSTLDDVALTNVAIASNGGDGIAVIINSARNGRSGRLVLHGTENRIVNNGGDGIHARMGDVVVLARTQITGNGGWGIRADTGSISISDGAVDTVAANGRGGLFAGAGIHLPAGLRVESNGGPGIIAAGTADIRLQDIQVQRNRGVGIGTVVASSGIRATSPGLILQGTENEIVDNGGHGIHAAAGSVFIQGKTRITGNSGWGILADLGRVSIWSGAMESITENGKGGIFASRGLDLPAGFSVAANGGPGIVVGGVDDTDLEQIEVRGNLGDGITVAGERSYADESYPGVILWGASNLIVDNGGDGIRTSRGFVSIRGGTWIEGNDGWGIHADGGPVSILDGTMDGISANGRGGLFASGGLQLPDDFVVERNGGPGIKVQDHDLQLANVEVCENDGNGIEIEFGDLVLTGPEARILLNSGDGIDARSASLSLKHADISSNNGWGVEAHGDGSVEVSHTDVRSNEFGGILINGLGLESRQLRVDKNGGPGLVLGGATAHIQKGQISRNTGCGMHVLGTDLDLVGLEVFGNDRGGIRFDDAGSYGWRTDTLGHLGQGANTLAPNGTAGGQGVSTIRASCISGNGGDGVRVNDGVSTLVIRDGDLGHNEGRALVNSETDCEVSAHANWWGEADDPFGQIDGVVDCGRWRTGPLTLTVSPERDPTYVQRGRSNSVPLILRDWTGQVDTVVLTTEDRHGWLRGAPVTMVPLDEDGLATTLLVVRVPLDVPLETVNPITVSIRSAPNRQYDEAVSFSVVATALADLALGVSGPVQAPMTGSPLTYTISIRNEGPDEAHAVRMTGTLPADLQLARVTTARGRCDAHDAGLLCNLGGLDAGTEIAVSMVVTPGISNRISTSFRANGVERDPSPLNNIAEDHMAVIERGEARGIQLEGPRSGGRGELLAFTARVSPVATTVPITFTWQATDQWWPERIRRSPWVSDTIDLMWHVGGQHTVTVVAHDPHGNVLTDTHTVDIKLPNRLVYLPLVIRGR